MNECFYSKLKLFHFNIFLFLMYTVLFFFDANAFNWDKGFEDRVKM